MPVFRMGVFGPRKLVNPRSKVVKFFFVPPPAYLALIPWQKMMQEFRKKLNIKNIKTLNIIINI